MIVRVLTLGIVAIVMSVASAALAQNVIWVHDGQNLPEHRLRGQARAQADVKAGSEKYYVSVCTFPMADKKLIRSYEIRRELYKESRIVVMANLCNDIIPNAFQQDAFVAGYNSVMDPVIGQRLGHGWKAGIEKLVRAQLRKHPKGTLQADDIEFETPY